MWVMFSKAPSEYICHRSTPVVQKSNLVFLLHLTSPPTACPTLATPGAPSSCSTATLLTTPVAASLRG
jgi:hypothetical protein